MIDAGEILFEKNFEGGPLFKNQVDMAHQFLSDKSSPYYQDSTVTDEYTKAQSRLKAYISQLLSGTVNRTITDDFKTALNLLLFKRLGAKDIASELTTTIINALSLRNNANPRTDKSSLTSNRFKQDFYAGNYICIINAKPINVEHPSSENDFSLRTFFMDDLLSFLTGENTKHKLYRFNFPMESYCEIFWSGLEKILIHKISPLLDNEELAENLHNKFAIKPHTYILLQDYYNIKNEADKDDLENLKYNLIHTIVDDVIEFLHRNRIILTFNVIEPVYTLPTIAINPNESNAKVYMLLESDQEADVLFKCTKETMLLWRIFVWDKMKAKNTSMQVPPPLVKAMELKKKETP